MSDFDKEAEREKLREKFAEEEESRQTTQQMSELLLQGATMTNQHCDTCGSPIFRHDGQAFCPTCQGEGGAAAEADAGPAQGGDTQDQRRQQPGDPREQATEGGQDPARRRQDPAAGSQPSPAEYGQQPAGVPEQGRDLRADRDEPGPRPDAGERSTTPAARGDSVAALEQTLARFARQAAETDDPRRARECLAAVREAAEALDAMRR